MKISVAVLTVVFSAPQLAAQTLALANYVGLPNLCVVQEHEVSNWLKTWQKRLRLDAWHIEVRIVPKSELKPDTLGNLKWKLIQRTAIISVLGSLGYDRSSLCSEIVQDMEYTVVHELIHLQLSVLPRDLNKKDIEEDVVNRMTDALMSLDKGSEFLARSSIPPKIPEAKAVGKVTIADRKQ